MALGLALLIFWDMCVDRGPGCRAGQCRGPPTPARWPEPSWVPGPGAEAGWVAGPHLIHLYGKT
jgi:hypothetical protein